ncbi:MAG: hypothetical protein LBC75_00790 [Fibromonadaceae bacterium]|jgi:hypothetical protein|nr:hypothetical protein [Fibromonadaceae bacterium]
MITIWQLPSYLRKLVISLLFIFTYSKAIPMPNQGIIQNSGLTAAMGFGTLNRIGCKNLLTCNVQGNYFYNSIISSGPSIKFFGGNLDSENNLVNQRYSANLNLTHTQEKYAVFVGPVLSFDNTNLSTLRNEFSHIGEGNEFPNNTNSTDCKEIFEKIGSSIGYHSGAGFLLTPNFGFTFGHSFDWMLTGTYTVSLSTSIAYNLRWHFEKLIENTKNSWLSLEYLISPNQSKNNINSFILGIVLGF